MAKEYTKLTWLKELEVTRPIIAAMTLLGSFVILAFVSMGYGNIEWKDIILIAVGAVITNFTTVINWYFGSSEGSNKKTEILLQESKNREEV